MLKLLKWVGILVGGLITMTMLLGIVGVVMKAAGVIEDTPPPSPTTAATSPGPRALRAAEPSPPEAEVQQPATVQGQLREVPPGIRLGGTYPTLGASYVAAPTLNQVRLAMEIVGGSGRAIGLAPEDLGRLAATGTRQLQGRRMVKVLAMDPGSSVVQVEDEESREILWTVRDALVPGLPVLDHEGQHLQAGEPYVVAWEAPVAKSPEALASAVRIFADAEDGAAVRGVQLLRRGDRVVVLDFDRRSQGAVSFRQIDGGQVLWTIPSALTTGARLPHAER